MLNTTSATTHSPPRTHRAPQSAGLRNVTGQTERVSSFNSLRHNLYVEDSRIAGASCSSYKPLSPNERCLTSAILASSHRADGRILTPVGMPTEPAGAYPASGAWPNILFRPRLSLSSTFLDRARKV
jgi:hypothetical protein